MESWSSEKATSSVPAIRTAMDYEATLSALAADDGDAFIASTTATNQALKFVDTHACWPTVPLEPRM